MARKAIFITGGIAILALAGAALAAQPVLEQRARAFTDVFFENLNRSDDFRVTRGNTRFDIWSRTIEIDDLEVERTSGATFTAKADTVAIEGIGVLGLLMHSVSSEQNQNPVAAIRSVSLDRITSPELTVTASQPGAGSVHMTYRMVMLDGIANGIISRMSIAGAEIRPEVENAKFELEEARIGRVAYDDVDVALYAALYMPDAEKSESFETIASGFSAEPITIKLRPARATGDERMEVTIGAMTGGASRVRPATLDLREVEAAANAFNEATAQGKQPSNEEVSRFAKAMVGYFRSLQMDGMQIDSFDMKLTGNDKGDMTVATGPLRMENMAAPELGLFEVRDLKVTAPDMAVSIARYGVENMNYEGLLGFFEQLESAVPEFNNVAQVLRMMPRGALFIEDMNLTRDQVDTKIGTYRIELFGPHDGMPEKLAIIWDDLDIALDASDPRTAPLRAMGVERLEGSAGYIMSYETDSKTLTLDRLGFDLAGLAALDITASANNIDLAALAETNGPEQARPVLNRVRVNELALRIEDRDGGLDRLITAIAEQKSLEVSDLKQGLIREAQRLVPLYLGDATDKVLPALTAFLDKPERLSVTARSKDENMSATAFLMAVQMAPQILPQLVDIEASTH